MTLGFNLQTWKGNLLLPAASCLGSWDPGALEPIFVIVRMLPSFGDIGVAYLLGIIAPIWKDPFTFFIAQAYLQASLYGVNM